MYRLALCLATAMAMSVAEQTPAAAQAAPLHLFILSGQSNMSGLDPDRTFTPAVARAFGADHVLVVKDAQSGQPIRRWYKKWEARAGENPDRIGDLYDELMAKVRKALGDRKPTTVTFVWMQGEKDARENRPGDYDAAMRGLIAQLRGDLHRDDMNFVIGRISDYGVHKSGERPSWNVIRRIHVKVADDDPRGTWVDTDDLNGPDDDLHYVKPDGYDELGRRFAASAIKLIGKADR